MPYTARDCAKPAQIGILSEQEIQNGQHVFVATYSGLYLNWSIGLRMKLGQVSYFFSRVIETYLEVSWPLYRTT